MNWGQVAQWVATVGIAGLVSVLVTIPKGRAEAKSTNTDANVKLTESNLKAAQEAASRSDKSREDAEKARDACRQSLVRSLDLNETVIDAVEQFLDRLEEQSANAEDYEDVHATLRAVRREIRELRP